MKTGSRCALSLVRHKPTAYGRAILGAKPVGAEDVRAAVLGQRSNLTILVKGNEEGNEMLVTAAKDGTRLY
jgi:hypothetical protein